jgi:hypothetical protein
MPPPRREALTSISRSQTRARAATSWKMPTMAAPPRLGLLDQREHRLAVGGVEARRRFVEQQRGVGMGKAARDVHALLLAARKGGGRQRPERAGMRSRSSSSRARASASSGRPSASSGSATTSQRGHPGHDAQELADIAQRLAPQREDLARRGLATSSPPIRIDPPRPGNCRRSCASAWTCPPRLSPVSATHSPGATEARARQTGITAPPWLCRVKDLERFSTSIMDRLTPAERKTRSCV